jgi:hypothetical protein
VNHLVLRIVYEQYVRLYFIIYVQYLSTLALIVPSAVGMGLTFVLVYNQVYDVAKL